MAMASSESSYDVIVPLNKVRENLLRFDNQEDVRVQKLLSEIPPFLRKAAVLIGLLFRDGIIQVLLTVRSLDLRTHGGLVCFPGGKVDDTDTNEIEAALREAKEEIGLEPDNVDVICTLPPMIVSPDYLTIPVVAVIKEEFEPVMNIDEVSDVFFVPLHRFLEDKDHEEKIVGIEIGKDAKFLVHYFSDKVLDKTYTTWGVTAMYCFAVATAVFGVSRFDCLTGTTMPPHDPFRHIIFTVIQSFEKYKNLKTAKM